MTDQRLSFSFWLSEFTDSPTAVRMGLSNAPKEIERARIETILAPGMQRIRDVIGSRVLISSGYRCPELNAAIRGARNSDHMRGLAADFTCPDYGSPLDVAKRLVQKAEQIGFDQLILEFHRWVHVSFPAAGDVPNRAVLTARRRSDGTTQYEGGLVT